MSSITVIGKNSYLARQFLATIGDADIDAVSHDDAGGIALSQTRCIVNFAYPAAYMTNPYDPGNDFDRALVERIKDTDIHFVTFSSRKVYDAAGPCPWNEDAPLSGQSEYGRNKIITEQYVRDRLGERHTIIRLGNIIEQEPGRHTFLGIALDSLRRENRIALNILPETKRDFLPVGKFAEALEKIIRQRPPGTYNLASGMETAVGDIAAWLVEGFGQGRIELGGEAKEDEFVMDIARIEALIGPVCRRDDIRNACMESGRRIKDG